jgi:predicted DNA-binding transcriptional regulator AlpA
VLDCRTIIAELEQHIQSLPREDCPGLLGELERLKAMAWAKTMTQVSPPAKPHDAQDRYLDVSEVVRRFRVKESWLYRHKRQMPHSQPSRKVLLFPEQAITKWFASRKGA